jgi:putative transposase
VPWGLYRFHQSRRPHFITFTCYRRQSFLNTPTVRNAFASILERTRLRFDFFIYGFVVMPNHVHLLISEPKQGTIATVIQSLKIATARYEKTHICQKMADMGHSSQTKADMGHSVTADMGRSDKTHISQQMGDMGHKTESSRFWQRRYYDRNVRDNKEFFEALKYIHRNPVRRGLVDKPEDWPWSSYRHYAFYENGVVTVESQWAAYKRNHPAADPDQLSRIFARDE